MSVPVLLVTGFLGSGKTTVVNHLLAHAEGRRIAAVVNDFGAINIDAELITGAADGVVSLSNGCICCSLESDLLRTLAVLLLLVSVAFGRRVSEGRRDAAVALLLAWIAFAVLFTTGRARLTTDWQAWIVAGVAVGLQESAEAAQMLPWVFAATIRRVGEPHSRRSHISRRPIIPHVGPQASDLGLAIPRCQNRNRDVVRVQLGRGQHMASDRFHQRSE